MFCPHCGSPCQTLREILSCCPRQTRAYTQDIQDHGAMTIVALFIQGPTDAMRRRVLAQLYPELTSTQEAA